MSFVSIALLKFSQQNINKDYLRYLILSPLVYQQSQENTRGVGNKNWVLTAIANTLITLPPFAEQQRIVIKLDELMAMCDELEATEKELDALENHFIEYLPKTILQMAIQGKLVPQNLHDEPASELLERIKAEKAELIKVGKLKKEKLLPPIAEDEIPYDLPDGWVWCRLTEILHDNIGGGTPSKQNSLYWNGDIHWASVKDLNCNILTTTKDKITDLGLKESSSNLIPEGNIIVCTRMGLGKIVFNKIPVAINQDLRALIFSQAKIDYRYFINWYKTLSIVGEGMTVKGIKIEYLEKIPFPLPPLAEQQRIVAKVDELMALCDELVNAQDTIVPLPEGRVIPFQEKQTEDEPLLMVAQGAPSREQSAELCQAIDDLFGDDEDE